MLGVFYPSLKCHVFFGGSFLLNLSLFFYDVAESRTLIVNLAKGV